MSGISDDTRPVCYSPEQVDLDPHFKESFPSVWADGKHSASTKLGTSSSSGSKSTWIPSMPAALTGISTLARLSMTSHFQPPLASIAKKISLYPTFSIRSWETTLPGKTRKFTRGRLSRRTSSYRVRPFKVLVARGARFTRLCLPDWGRSTATSGFLATFLENPICRMLSACRADSLKKVGSKTPLLTRHGSGRPFAATPLTNLRLVRYAA